MIDQTIPRQIEIEDSAAVVSPPWRKPLIAAFVALVLIGLWLISRVNYLLFHSLVEVFGLMVAWGMFTVAWNTRRLLRHGYFLLLGVASLWIGVIDFLHLLAYKGMSIFPGFTADLATQLWIAGRYLQAGSMLAAPLFLTRRLRVGWLLSAYGLATGLLLAAIFGRRFPVCFIEGEGLTPFKVASEYIICGLIAGGVFYLYQRRQYLDRRVWKLVTAALVLSIATELTFTLYDDVYGFFNQVGHFLKILVFFLLYQGVIVSGLQQPYRTLFRELAQSEDRYRMLFDTMTEGFALHEIVTDEQGRPCDYRFLEVNKAFERLTGLKRTELVGRRILEVLPDTEPYWIETYGRVALDGTPSHFERFFPPLKRWYQVIAYRPHPGRFAVIFTDISERKQAEETLQASRLAALNLMEDAVEAHRKAEQISADLERASERLKRDNREVGLYNRILKEFIEKSEYDVFAPVLDIILEEMASRHGVFGYIPEPGHLICPSLSAMLDECEIEGKCIHYPPEKWKGLWSRALREKRSFLSNQPAAIPRGHVPIRNNLAVPILFRGEAIGLLNLANKETDFTENDRELLEAMGGRIAPVLYAWIQHRLREEERQRAEADLHRAHMELEQRVRERTRVLKTTVEALEVEIVRRRELEETLRASEQQVRFFAVQYLAAQEQERKRIAGELHDSLASTLVAAKYRLEKMGRELETGIDPGETLQEVITLLSGLNKEVRRIMVDLRPAILDDLGLLPALNWLCREFEKTYGHIRVEMQIDLAENELAETMKTPIFRLTQEALNNVAKHSGASRVIFSFGKVDGRIVLIIRDNGRGFEAQAVVRGFGLTTMKERTELSGGDYRLESARGQGTVLFASWPLGD